MIEDMYSLKHIGETRGKQTVARHDDQRVLLTVEILYICYLRFVLLGTYIEDVRIGFRYARFAGRGCVGSTRNDARKSDYWHCATTL